MTPWRARAPRLCALLPLFGALVALACTRDKHARVRRIPVSPLEIAVAGSAWPASSAGSGAGKSSRKSVLEHHGGSTRAGVYTDPAFTRGRAARLHRDRSFAAKMSGPTYAQPLYVAATQASRDLVVVATEQNQVVAFGGQDGHVVWQRALGLPVPKSELPCGNLDPLGITGTPAVDPASRTLFVDAMIRGPNGPRHSIFGLSLEDGSTRRGWPVDVDASVRFNGLPFHSRFQNQRSGLLIAKGNLYVPYGGHFGDCGEYRGWVVGVPLENPSAPFAWVTRGVGGGIWAPSAIVWDGAWLYVTTGNTKNAREWGGGEAVVRLSPNLSFAETENDYFTPADWRGLDRDDDDLGGSGPVLLSLRSGAPSDLAIALGKDGKAYLLDRDHLGGEAHALREEMVSTDAIITAPATYRSGAGDYVTFVGNGVGCSHRTKDGTVTARVTAGSPPGLSIAWCAEPGGKGSPIVTSTPGGTDTIVWRVSAETDNKLYGYDGETGNVIFDGGGRDERMRSVRRFQAPIVANGRLFVAGDDELYAFAPGD
jgi:hypothetical protein